ncbi:MAG TPA: hypothetical protein VKP04_02435, partial [Ktedonobacteraceae bacterium]|nr:hypothetical protein [Ktedonobacteraceae bacterium]
TSGKFPFSDRYVLNDMFLGANMSMTSIIHEFGHQLDRYYQLSWSVPVKGVATFPASLSGNPNAPSFQYQQLSGRITGYARGDFEFNAGEVFADAFMTAVLNGQKINGKPYQADSPDKYGNKDIQWNGGDMGFEDYIRSHIK